MKLIGRELLTKFGMSHTDAKTRTTYFINEFEEAEWKTPAEIKAVHPSASFLPENHVVFNIRGNRYRLLVQINYKLQIVYCKEIGKHSEYDNWKLK